MNRLWDAVAFSFPFLFFAVSAFFYHVKHRPLFCLFSACCCLTCFLLLGNEAGVCLSSDHNANFCFPHNCIFFKWYFLKFYFWMGLFKKRASLKFNSLMFAKCLPKISITAFLFWVTGLGSIFSWMRGTFQGWLISESFGDHYLCSLKSQAG